MSRWFHKAAVSLSLFALWGCDDDSTAKEPAPWASLAPTGAAEAFLAVGGTSSSNVFVVGADKGQGPALLHWDGTAWTRLAPPIHGDLWWVHPVEGGATYFAGGRSNIVKYDGTTFTRMPTPGLARNTVFGLWGLSDNDLWAVGSVSGRNGFIWRFDGTSWNNVPLPDDLPRDSFGDPPGLFKVWGRAANDVWFVGARGTLLHFNGTEIKRIDSGSELPLFTVHGNDDVTVAVGGAGPASLLEVEGDESVENLSSEASGLVQGVWLTDDGKGVACGARGTVYTRVGNDWKPVETGLAVEAESLHAAWIDPDGGVWTVGGNVLSSLDKGVILYQGKEAGTVDASLTTLPTPPDPTVCPAADVNLAPEGSIARRWNEHQLNSIRRDIPRPGVHARNLFHTSAAMYDAWATYDSTADGIFFRERHTSGDIEADRAEAISYAAYRVLTYRYDAARAIGGVRSNACLTAFMQSLGYDPAFTSTEGDSPAAIGNRIAQTILDSAREDGANELNNYADVTSYAAANPPLIVDQPGTNGIVDPQTWQELNLAVAVTQNGIVIDGGVQKYIGSNWGGVTPFALARNGTDTFFAPDNLPRWGSEALRQQAVELIRMSSELDPGPAGSRDYSPAAFGNNPLGTDEGSGHGANPVTGEPYAPNILPVGDFSRVLAEFWADGPKSETPPGHWNTLFNQDVSDSPQQTFKYEGTGDALDRLEWDVKGYVAVNTATHDAAIAAWEQKRVYLGPRPISVLRHMAELGQSSDPGAPSYNESGLPLVPGLIELITEASSTPGERHEHLAKFVGEVAILSWRGEPGDTRSELGQVGWIRGSEWIPYQLRTFVTPAFPGYVSGHSTFSRAAAEVLTAFTGSPYFPGGFAEFVAPTNGYLKFEKGPSVDVRLQWASYYDAADQAGQSRRYGGIHVSADDFDGRRIGHEVGLKAWEKTRAYFDGTAVE